MTDRRIIDTEALWARTRQSPDMFRAVQQWLRVNGIEPRDVPVPSDLVIEDSAYGLVIRYEAYLRNAEGRPYVDPDDPDRAAMENRTVLLHIAPPADWLTSIGSKASTDLVAELRTAAARLRAIGEMKGSVDADSLPLLEGIRGLLRATEPLTRWMDEQARHIDSSGMYDVLAVDIARAINATDEPSRGEDGHITDRHSGAYLYEQLMRAAGETP